MNPQTIQLLASHTGCPPEALQQAHQAGLIDERRMRNQLIRARFNQLLAAQMPLMDAYFLIGDEFAVSESTVMHVLKQHR